VIPVDVLIYGVAGERLWNSPDWGDSLPLGAAVAIFGAAFVISLLAAMFAAALAVPLEVAGYLLDTGPLVLLGQTIADGMSLSFAALAGTLLYFAAKIR